MISKDIVGISVHFAGVDERWNKLVPGAEYVLVKPPVGPDGGQPKLVKMCIRDRGIGRQVAGIGIKDGDLSCLQQPLGDLGYQHGPIAFAAVTAIGYYRI